MTDKEKLKRSKRIALISINNETIKEYDSIKKCATDLDIHIQRIGEILSGNRIHYKGLYFKYI